MATTEKYAVGTVAALMTTELNSLATSAGLTAGAISSAAYNNAQGGSGDGYPLGSIELVLAAPAAAPAAGSAAYVWLLSTNDGTTYEDGSATIIPGRPPDAVIPLRAVTGAQRVIIRAVTAPMGTFYALLAQNSGASFAAAGNQLRWLPYTRQGV